MKLLPSSKKARGVRKKSATATSTPSAKKAAATTPTSVGLDVTFMPNKQSERYSRVATKKLMNQ